MSQSEHTAVRIIIAEHILQAIQGTKHWLKIAP